MLSVRFTPGASGESCRSLEPGVLLPSLSSIHELQLWFTASIWEQSGTHFINSLWAHNPKLPETHVALTWNMMTSSNGNIFRVTGHLCGEFTGPRWIPHTKASDGALMFSLICVWINGWVNNGEAGDLRRYRAHYVVTVMNSAKIDFNFELISPLRNESLDYTYQQ